MIRPRRSVSLAWRELERIKSVPRAIAKRSILTAGSRRRSGVPTGDHLDECSVMMPCSITTSMTTIRHLRQWNANYVGTVSTTQGTHRVASFPRHSLHSYSSGSRRVANGIYMATSGMVHRGKAASTADTAYITEPSGEDKSVPDKAGVSYKIDFETGKLALLADGAVMARQGGTVVMVTAVSDRREMDDTGFLPLSVEYREKAHASGKIPRTRDRREGQATDTEVLVGRAIDRVLRPLFPPGYCFETQIYLPGKDVSPEELQDLKVRSFLFTTGQGALSGLRVLSQRFDRHAILDFGVSSKILIPIHM